MLNEKLIRKLESIIQLPTLPYTTSEVLSSIDDINISVNRLASLIEKDQALSAKVLSVANSPFYGFQRKISTIELAIVVLGSNTLKEIILSLIIKNFFSKIRKDLFDIDNFWKYSIFCGSAARVLARRLGYRLTGEAFVAGLMHDIGILIIVQYFSREFLNIREYQKENTCSLYEAEKQVMNSSHTEIGTWLAAKWNLPENLCESIYFHHSSFQERMEMKQNLLQSNGMQASSALANAEMQDGNEEGDFELLTAIVAMTEWFAAEAGFKDWANDSRVPPLYLATEILDELKQHELLDPDSVIEVIKQEIIQEYEKATVLRQFI